MVGLTADRELGTIDERMLILLDIEKPMNSRDMQLIGEARGSAAQQDREVLSNKL